MHPFSSWVLWSSLWSSFWTLSWVDCLYSCHLVLLLFFFPFLWNIFLCHFICLNCCLYFYVSGRLVTFLDLREVALCRRCAMHLSSILLFHPPKGQGPACPRVVSVLCFLTQSAGCRAVVFLLMRSSPHLLVGETDLEACADFLARGVCPCSLLGGAGSWSSSGRALSRGMYRVSCGLRKSLGSLSTEGWVCVPTHLLFSLGASYHWSL